MPMYEYECIMCNKRYEVEQPITSICAPVCCGAHMRQLYYAPGISFKGKGWGHQ
jgi:putative FmdB family regulatory protein